MVDDYGLEVERARSQTGSAGSVGKKRKEGGTRRF